jgi:hypothetical protein
VKSAADQELAPDLLLTDRLDLTFPTQTKKALSEIAEQARQAKTTPEVKSKTTPEVTPEVTPEPKLAPRPFLRKSAAVLAQEEAVSKAIAGEITAFPRLVGEPIVVRIARPEASKASPASADHEKFRLTIEGTSFDVGVAKGLEPKELLAKVIEYYAKVPAHLRPALKSIQLETVSNPEDAYWAKIYGRDDFASAATAGGGKITFWNLDENPYNLIEGTFSHEMAHLFGAGYSTSRTRHAEMIPPGWEEAFKADGNQVSTYGSNNLNEDFAEAWRYYQEARRTPETLEAFRQKHPNRTRILEAIDQHEFDAKFKIGAYRPDQRETPGNEGLRHV